MSAIVSTPRTQADRWTAALERALDDGLRVERSFDDEAVVLSPDGSVRYTIRLEGRRAVACSCPAGQRGLPHCKHRALYYWTRVLDAVV